MKPPPPAALLLRNQRWTVTEAVHWELAEAGTCYFAMGFHQRCGQKAVVIEKGLGVFNREGLCEQHMGYHLWIENGVLYQWRAEPPYRQPPRLSRIQRSRRGLPYPS